MEDDLSGFRGVTEDALSDSEELEGGCPFSFQKSYRWRMPFQVSEELMTENALTSSICNSSETSKDILHR
jgi:hypothetical protein